MSIESRGPGEPGVETAMDDPVELETREPLEGADGSVEAIEGAERSAEEAEAEQAAAEELRQQAEGQAESAKDAEKKSPEQLKQEANKKKRENRIYKVAATGGFFAGLFWIGLDWVKKQLGWAKKEEKK